MDAVLSKISVIKVMCLAKASAKASCLCGALIRHPRDEFIKNI